jgi:single-strand DNA-binding protein
MSKDLNVCHFIGRLGKDVEIRFMASGDAVANLTLAVGDDYKTKEGQKVEQTEWVRAVAYRKSAEILAEYTKKGSQLYISGKMKTKKWQDQTGADRYTTEILINEFQFIGGNSDNQAKAAPKQAAPPAQAAASQGKSFYPDDDEESQIPF